MLGISTHVVYYWIETRQVEARKGPGSARLIGYRADVELPDPGRRIGHLGRLDSDAEH